MRWFGTISASTTSTGTSPRRGNHWSRFYVSGNVGGVRGAWLQGPDEQGAAAVSLTGRPVIYVKAGDDFPLRIGAQNDDGTPRDLTGETIEFRAAPDFNWLGPVVYKTDGDGITIEDAEAGVFAIMFSRDDFIAPATLVWEVKITATDGSVSTLDFATEQGNKPVKYGLLVIEAPMVLAG